MSIRYTLFGALTALVLLGIVLLGKTVISHAQPDPALAGDARAVAASANGFALRLYAKLNTNPKSNLFFSPTSLSMALSMTYNGAAGQTKTDMAKVLGFTGMDLTTLNKGQAALLDRMQKSDPKVDIAIANALFAQQDFKFLDDFLRRNKDYYHADIKNMDITGDAGMKEINGWVARQTHDRITDLLKPGDLNATMKLVLTNAIYFKGAWSLPFDKADTRNDAFTLPDGTTKQVPMMHLTKSFRYLKGETFQAVRLPYGQGRMSMYIFLPNTGVSLHDFSRHLTPANWGTWMGRFNEADIELSLPRFKANYQEKMNASLSALGMGNAFSNDADFSSMDGRRDLCISFVRHQATLDVNEEGSTATAATAVGMELATAVYTRNTNIIFTVDHPFFCAIRDDDTGAILFMGNIVNPE